MKELSIEEKARRYDEAMERAKNYYSTTDSSSDIKLIGLMFPELIESEDERIRKALIRFHKSTIDVDGIKGEDIIAWLEKQGEHAKFRESIQIGDEVTRNKDGMLVNLSQLKRVAKPNESKQGEQKAMYHDICDKCVRQPTCQSDRFLQQEEQKPAEWTEEDEEQLEFCCAAIEMSDFSNVDYRTQAVTWLNLLKDRVHPQPKQEILEKLKEWLDEYVSDLADVDTASLICSFTNYLDGKLPKSLRLHSQWKPSDEQMKALWEVYKGGDEQAALASLYSDLKELKGYSYESKRNA